MTIRQIRYFLVLARELHFWNTAEKVNISQSSLSRQIQSLEEELDVKLFVRDKRNVKLTEAGIFLYEKWKNIIDELDRTHRQAKNIEDGTSGMVSITYSGSIAFSFLPKLLQMLNENMPDLNVLLTEPTDVSNLKLLVDYEIDMAFSRDRIRHPSISSTKLYAEPVCLVVPENHWITQESYQGLEDMKEDHFIISPLHHETFYATLLRKLFAKYNFEPKSTIQSDFGSMILNLVSKEVGVSILPYSFKYANYKNVRFIPMEEEVELFINWRKLDRNKAVHNIIETAKSIAIQYP